ncbi:MAG: hypothetical protein A2252_04540 [Elusimicrobia bacterium RIFOXYA2_FULL_39_19]|nr:MAG: hypothetical protein A2252_04540 [Elusimicrobia bacterium RIFOXYA2_FULL_39_19]
MKKVLIVDDDEEIIDLVSFILENGGYHAVSASDISGAINAVCSETPDLIVLDLMLPEGNGFKLSRLLRLIPKYKHIPIIMLTAVTYLEEKYIEQMMEIQDYITKPFDPKDFIEKINKQISSPENDGCIPVNI